MGNKRLLGLVALAGLLLGLALTFAWRRAPPEATPPDLAPPDLTALPPPSSAQVDASAPTVAAGPAPEPSEGAAAPALESACDPCFEGTPLSWQRSPAQVAAVQAWDQETWERAVAAVWQLQEAGQLDFAEARRDDQALLIDRRLGTGISPATRTALLDLHGESQAELEAARGAAGSREAVGRALHLYRDGAADLLTPAQVEALFAR